jgi:hypothetical protein
MTQPTINPHKEVLPYRRTPVSRWGGALATKMDAGLRRHDERSGALAQNRDSRLRANDDRE